MVTTLDEYAQLSESQKGKINKADLKTIIDNQLSANPAATQNIVNTNEIKDVIVDVVTKTLEQTLAIKIKEIVDGLKGILSADINPLKAEVKNLRDDLNEPNNVKQ